MAFGGDKYHENQKTAFKVAILTSFRRALWGGGGRTSSMNKYVHGHLVLESISLLPCVKDLGLRSNNSVDSEDLWYKYATALCQK